MQKTNERTVHLWNALKPWKQRMSQHSKYFRDFEDLVTAWIPPTFEVLPFVVKRITQNYPYLLSLKAGTWQKESSMPSAWATRLGDTNCLIDFFIMIKGHLCLSPPCTEHVETQRHPKTSSIATAEPMSLCKWYPRSLIIQPFLHFGFQSGCTPEPENFRHCKKQLTRGYGFSLR